jgi:hypothetical protein
MIREKKVRNKNWYVVIDIIKSCNPSKKPSKIWSEYKKKIKVKAFVIESFEFKATNGRVYNLECVGEKDKAKVIEQFSPKRNVTAKITTTKAVPNSTSGYAKIVPCNAIKDAKAFKTLIIAIRNLADQLESL